MDIRTYVHVYLLPHQHSLTMINFLFLPLSMFQRKEEDKLTSRVVRLWLKLQLAHLLYRVWLLFSCSVQGCKPVRSVAIVFDIRCALSKYMFQDSVLNMFALQ
jgi:hypothetical protein